MSDPWADVRERLPHVGVYAGNKTVVPSAVVQHYMEDVEHLLTDADTLLAVVRLSENLSNELWETDAYTPENLRRLHIALAALPEHLR